MIRDSIKDLKYFKDYSKGFERRTKKRLTKFKNGEISAERVQTVKLDMALKYLHKSIAGYSMGLAASSIKPDYFEALKLIHQYWPGGWKICDEYGQELNQYGLGIYGELLRLISLGILIDIPSNEISKIAEVLELDGVRDLIYSYLLSSRLRDTEFSAEESYQKYFYIPQVYQKLRQAILESSKFDSQKLINNFIRDDWYQKHSELNEGPFESHKSPHDIYYGYWCFEAAAVVKIKGLDDSSFRDHPYYPADLVHGMDNPPPKKKKGFFGW